MEPIDSWRTQKYTQRLGSSLKVKYILLGTPVYSNQPITRQQQNLEPHPDAGPELQLLSRSIIRKKKKEEGILHLDSELFISEWILSLSFILLSFPSLFFPVFIYFSPPINSQLGWWRRWWRGWWRSWWRGCWRRWCSHTESDRGDGGGDRGDNGGGDGGADGGEDEVMEKLMRWWRNWWGSLIKLSAQILQENLCRYILTVSSSKTCIRRHTLYFPTHTHLPA